MPKSTNTPDLCETITCAVGDMMVRVLETHLGDGPETVKARDEVQSMFFTLARYAQSQDRDDIADLMHLYAASAIEAAKH